MPDPALWALIGGGITLVVLLLVTVVRRLVGGRRMRDPHHRIRALEAELRIERRKAEESANELGSRNEALASLSTAHEASRARLAQLEARCQQLETSLNQELRKTGLLRQELADHIQEMTRTHVELRDARTELEVFNTGSDMVHAEATRLWAERDRLEAEVQALRAQLSAAGISADAPPGAGDKPG